MGGSIGANAFSPTAVPEWNVKLAIPEAQAVYSARVAADDRAAGLDDLRAARRSGTRDAAQGGNAADDRARSAPASVDEPTSSRMTLHDQMALAEAAAARPFLRALRCDALRVDAEGYTRVDKNAGRPGRVCACEPRRNDFMTHFSRRYPRDSGRTSAVRSAAPAPVRLSPESPAARSSPLST